MMAGLSMAFGEEEGLGFEVELAFKAPTSRIVKVRIKRNNGGVVRKLIHVPSHYTRKSQSTWP